MNCSPSNYIGQREQFDLKEGKEIMTDRIKLKKRLTGVLVVAIITASIATYAPINASEEQVYLGEETTDETTYLDSGESVVADEVITADELTEETEESLIAEDVIIDETDIESSELVAASENNEILAASEVVATGTLGEGGAPWTLDDDGVVTVGSGFIDVHTETSVSNWNSTSPWDDYREYVREIRFTEQVEARRMQAMFSRLPNLENIQGLELINTSRVTDMSFMFNTPNSQIASLDLSAWDVSQVTTMQSMFAIMSSGWIGSLTELDVSTWDTSSLTDMTHMFIGVNIEHLDLTHFDTSNVTSMFNMFGVSSFTTLDISTWDTGNVTTISSMFSNARVTNPIDVSNWDTSSMVAMDGAFIGQTLTDITNWDTSSVVDMRRTFEGVRFLDPNLDLTGWDVSNVTSMGRLFANSTAISLDLSTWNTSSLTNAGQWPGTEDMFNTQWSDFDILRSLTLGSEFRFLGDPGLRIFDHSNYTGYWQHIGSGTANRPNGEFVFTSDELWQEFDGETMAGTFVWQRSADTYEVRFDLQGGSGNFSTQNIESGGLAERPMAYPSREGYRFIGWFTTSTQETVFDFSSTIESDITIYAGWEVIVEEVLEVTVTMDCDRNVYVENGELFYLRYGHPLGRAIVIVSVSDYDGLVNLTVDLPGEEWEYSEPSIVQDGDSLRIQFNIFTPEDEISCGDIADSNRERLVSVDCYGNVVIDGFADVRNVNFRFYDDEWFERSFVILTFNFSMTDLNMFNLFNIEYELPADAELMSKRMSALSGDPLFMLEFYLPELCDLEEDSDNNDDDQDLNNDDGQGDGGNNGDLDDDGDDDLDNDDNLDNDETTDEEEEELNNLPQTGVVATSVALAGVALAGAGTIIAYTKKKR